MWDLALLTCVPGMRIACPRDPQRVRELLREAVATPGPTAMRYPKATAGEDVPNIARMDGMDILHRGPHSPLDVLLVAVGPMATPCLQAARILSDNGFGATVVDPRWVWPINPGLVSIAARHRLTVCVEDGIAGNGIGAHLTRTVASDGAATQVRALGLPTEFIAHAPRDRILADCGLTGEGIAAACLEWLPATERIR